MMENTIKEMAWLIDEAYDNAEMTGSELHGYEVATHIYNAGYRKQSEGEWEMFSLITSTYYGKQYYFLNKDGSVYSRASHSNMSRDEAVDEFLSIFRE